LGTKDSNVSFIPIALGIILIILGGGWFMFRNRELIKVWIKKE
jgi:LPXTG-motif cell wall-anchored protein